MQLFSDSFLQMVLNGANLTFPEIQPILLTCLLQPRTGVLLIPQVISGFDKARELTEINLKKDNYFYQLHGDGIVSLDLDFKMQFGNRLLELIHNFFIQTILMTDFQSLKNFIVRKIP